LRRPQDLRVPRSFGQPDRSAQPARPRPAWRQGVPDRRGQQPAQHGVDRRGAARNALGTIATPVVPGAPAPTWSRAKQGAQEARSRL